MKNFLLVIFISLNIFSVAQTASKNSFIVIIGTAQDAGYPQMGCNKECCKRVIAHPQEKRMVVSFALVEPETQHWWLFEATPDIKEQLQLFQQLTNHQYSFLPNAVFITHAHIGHYTGLMYFGREAMNTKSVNVFVMPRMKNYLMNNGPWSQLVSLKNIELKSLKEDSTIHLSNKISVTSFLVPHRDEFSETVGFNIQYNQSKVLFIPDIDKWNKFNRNINTMIHESSFALLDGTFYKEGEVEGRPMNEIPHPFIEESLLQFQNLSVKDKAKIYFIHFNHTNPLLHKDFKEYKSIKQKGLNVAEQGQKFILY